MTASAASLATAWTGAKAGNDDRHGELERATVGEALGADGEEHIVFTVADREELEELILSIKEMIPTAFYTVERVNRAGESGAVVQESTRWSIASWLKGVRRN